MTDDVAADVVPTEPTLSCADLPGTGGRIGSEPEDFVVDEVADVEPSGSGEHRFVRIRKRGMNTQDAIRAVARAAGVRDRDIGSAGMKDKYAVTTQWLSLPAQSGEPSAWELPIGLEVLEATHHDRKLRTGQLSGNRFRVRLVGVHDDALARAQTIAARLGTRGLPNAFGAQRFGRGGSNLPRALAWLGAGARARVSRFELKLWPSVVQSEIFNRYLERRCALGLERLLEGEVVRLDGTGTTFVVDDPDKELPRYAARDLHPTGPILGPKMRPARAAAKDLEDEVLANLGLTDDALRPLGRHAPGTRRDLIVYPGDLSVEAPSSDTLMLSFFLPSGSYATQLIRELTRTPFFER